MPGETPSIFTIIAFILASWLIIHALAVLGIFVALAFPIWWLIAPHTTVCFLCRSKLDGELCPFCKSKVYRSDKIWPHPRNLLSAVLNGFIIFIFSLVSTGLVFGESILLFKLGIPPTQKTVSFNIPPKGYYKLGEIFPMKIEITGIKTPINTVQADIGFDPAKLEALDVITDTSFANIFIQKEINNDVGYARLSGGLPNPGFSANSGVFGTIIFKSKTPGAVKVEFLPTSMVLANDSTGTNVLKDYASISYLILPERVTSSEEESQKKLISDNTSVLGESSQNTQIKFYSEEQATLGASTEEALKSVKKPGPFSFIADFPRIVETIDAFIISQWVKVFEIITGKPTSSSQ